MELKVDKEFAKIIPPITTEEYADLEKSILQEGCRDALVVWDDNILLDGHHRFQICRKHGIPFKTISKSFEGRDQAKEWMIRNQLGRRNLPDYEKTRLALMLKPAIEEKAKEKQTLGGKVKVYQKSDKPLVTLDEIAKLAGVSHDTVHKVEIIEKEASPEQKEQLWEKKKSINRVYQEIKGKAKNIKQKSKEVKHHKRKAPELISESFERAWNGLFVEIKNAKALKWKTTSKEAAIRKVNVLIDVIQIT